MVSFADGKTITLVRRSVTGRDSNNNDVYGETLHVIDGCPVWPTGSSEDNSGRTTVTTGLTAVLPPGTDVTAVDEVRIGDDPYTIEGDPEEWTSPLSGFEVGIQVQLSKVTG